MNCEKIDFRIAEISDAKKIIDHMEKIINETDNLSFVQNEYNKNIKIEEEKISKIDSLETSFLMLAINKNQIIGHLIFSGNNKIKTKHVGTLGMAIVKDYRGHRIGYTLLGKAILICEKKGIIKNKFNDSI